jgi:hypothetical protein
LAKALARQKATLSRANAALFVGVDPSDGDSDEAVTTTPLPALPANLNALVSEDNRPGNILSRDSVVETGSGKFGVAKCWDNEGALATRGRRVGGGTSHGALCGRRDRIARLHETARFQLGRAGELEVSDPELSEIYFEMAGETEIKAQAIQAELNARMAHARAARTARKPAAKPVVVVCLTATDD